MNKQKPPYRNPGPVTTREEFIHNFIRAEQAIVYRLDDPTVKVIQALIGSVYDLQQQIAALQEKIDELV